MSAFVTRIKQAIQAEEATLFGPEWRRAHTDACNWPGDIPGYCDCNSADRVKKRSAANRRLLELHCSAERVCAGDRDNPSHWFDICKTCGSGEANEYPTEWPCDTLKIVASGYGIDFGDETTVSP